ncbi:hypothetical protein DL766_008731 [Monosporascus sp. MC13-8B]|uniref:2EXR domain-containing protein n=1 Tax=Monosporascus cannonballus TaxID=155416 RepID=A0ABY0HFX9_9PEZI|nr:hypothetical protein DL762_001609 [Monosporascus cannonballus]RYP00273.1 hypothetical protein DL763_000884 [Monosporascus cannonballus]RYP18186.1 hypothetical protein DL766_008731 [Monosporascus sp. MC13-8B]
MAPAVVPATQVAQKKGFPKFHLLDEDIRKKIWRAAIEIPRIVDVEEGDDGASSGDGASTSVCVEYRGHRCVQVSPVFLVNRESRAIAFQYPFIQFRINLDPGFAEDTNFLVTKHDIVSLGAMHPSHLGTQSDIFTCGGSAQLVQNLMMNWEPGKLLDFDAPSLSVFALQSAGNCIRQFRNRSHLQKIYFQLEGVSDSEFLAKATDALVDKEPMEVINGSVILDVEAKKALSCFRLVGSWE